MTSPAVSSADPVNLELVEGEPYNRQFRILDAATIWPERQVWAQVRQEPGASLLVDLTPQLSVDEDPGTTDLLINLNLSGADTRRLRHAARWDLFISEPGPAQEAGRRLLQGAVTVDRAITTGPPA